MSHKMLKFARSGLACLMLSVFLWGCSQQPTPSGAAENVHRIAFAYFGPDEACEQAILGYLDGLKQSGFEEGKNLQVIRQHAFGEIGNLPQMMQSLDHQGLDVIVPMSTPVLAAACQMVKKTKVVFVYTYDPIAAGVGSDFTNHLPNFTGVGSFPPIPETMQTIRRLWPSIKTIGTLYNPAEANSVRAVQAARDILQSAGIELIELSVGGTGEILLAAQGLVAKKPDVIWVTGDNTVLQGLEGVIRPVQAAHIPLILNDPEFVQRGAVLAIGIGWHASGMAAGKMAARVLQGENPAQIPIINLAQRKVVANEEQLKLFNLTTNSFD